MPVTISRRVALSTVAKGTVLVAAVVLNHLLVREKVKA